MIYRLGRRKKLHAEINVVPYIDVMLVLLIIFMVLSPLLIQGIDVNLPRTDTTKMSIQNEPLVVSIDKNGNYFLNLGEEEIAISLDELKDKAFVIFDANPSEGSEGIKTSSSDLISDKKVGISSSTATNSSLNSVSLFNVFLGISVAFIWFKIVSFEG